jgi:hypothetical protein
MEVSNENRLLKNGIMIHTSKTLQPFNDSIPSIEYRKIKLVTDRKHVTPALFRKIVAVYCENHTKHTDTLFWQNAKF